MSSRVPEGQRNSRDLLMMKKIPAVFDKGEILLIQSCVTKAPIAERQQSLYGGICI